MASETDWWDGSSARCADLKLYTLLPPRTHARNIRQDRFTTNRISLRAASERLHYHSTDLYFSARLTSTHQPRRQTSASLAELGCDSGRQAQSTSLIGVTLVVRDPPNHFPLRDERDIFARQAEPARVRIGRHFAFPDPLLPIQRLIIS